MENFMRIEKLEFVKNIDKFENNSDEYVEINLNRKVTELSSVSYEKKLYSFYLFYDLIFLFFCFFQFYQFFIYFQSLIIFPLLFI